MMMKGDGLGVGNEGDGVGSLRSQGIPFSKMHTETCTDKGDPSLGFAVTPAPGFPCGECRALAGLGAISRVIILCMFTNCKLSQIKCIEFRYI